MRYLIAGWAVSLRKGAKIGRSSALAPLHPPEQERRQKDGEWDEDRSVLRHDDGGRVEDRLAAAP
ncbi:MAG: hypothetical protein J4N91_09105, partial [Chloroflexi bacterium]|nr:hypothetical protein [Chloroflexota bacterium]